jgi:hypothetical protein
MLKVVSPKGKDTRGFICYFPFPLVEDCPNASTFPHSMAAEKGSRVPVQAFRWGRRDRQTLEVGNSLLQAKRSRWLANRYGARHLQYL